MMKEAVGFVETGFLIEAKTSPIVFSVAQCSVKKLLTVMVYPLREP